MADKDEFDSLDYGNLNTGDDFYADAADDTEIEFQDFDATGKAPLGSGGGYGAAPRGEPPKQQSSTEFSYGAPVESKTYNLEGDYAHVDFAESNKTSNNNTNNNSNNNNNNKSNNTNNNTINDDDDEVIEPTAKFWTVQFYRPLFNVDSYDVLNRIVRAVTIYPSFTEAVGNNPDLYGPIWISTTLVFLLAAVGNFATYLSYWLNDKSSDFEYDFTKVTFGSMLVYGYVTLFPLVLWAGCKWQGFEIGFLDHCCLIGYSLVIYLPASLMLLIPISAVNWVLMCLACALVCGFLVRNYYAQLKPNPVAGLVVLGTLLIVNVCIALAFRLYLFQYVELDDEPTTQAF